MDLAELRAYVANVLDYDPSNPTYRDQVGQLLNDAHDRIVTDKPWPWAEVEKTVTANPDATATINVTNGASAISTGAAFFESWMEGQVIELDNEPYEVAKVNTSTAAVLTSGYEGTTGTASGVVIARYLDLPQDCIAVLQVIRRSDSRSPEDPGRLVPLTRYEDEWANLPLGEVNLPQYWVPADTTFTPAPSRPPVLGAAAAAPGQGTRTIEVVITHVYAGRESSPSSPVSITLTDTQDLTVTLTATLASSGLRRRVYARDTASGLYAYRLLADNTGAELFDTTGGTFTFTDVDTTSLSSETFAQRQRLTRTGGTTQRIRLYPRQDRLYRFTVRYLRQPRRLEDDTDAPDLPAAHHVALAYRALEQLAIKHGNGPQSQLFARRAEKELLAMEGRYLTQKPRRWVKGFMEPGLLDRVPQYTQLRRT